MLEGINWVSVIAAALAGYLLGTLWFMPQLLGNAWMTALGKKKEDLGSPAQAMIVAGVAALITAICLAVVLKGCGATTLGAGVVLGIVIGGGIVFATQVSDYLSQGASMKLLWVQGGYRFVYIVLMSAVIGALQ
jgi:Protein of unknown function (DUF1761)